MTQTQPQTTGRRSGRTAASPLVKRLFLTTILTGLLFVSLGLYLVLKPQPTSPPTAPPSSPPVILPKFSPVHTLPKTSPLPDWKFRDPLAPALFVNPSSMCYRNAALQVFLRLRTVDFCALSQDPQNALSVGLCSVQQEVRDKTGVKLNIDSRVSAHLKDYGTFSNVRRQQDASEFLMILRMAMDAQKGITQVDTDRISDFFHLTAGFTRSTTCTSDHTPEVALVEDPIVLLLPPGFDPATNKDPIEIADLLRAYSHTQQQFNCDCPFCAMEAHRGVDQRMADKQLTGFPEIAMIQLPRFTSNADNAPRVNNLIRAPLDGLQLRPDPPADLVQPQYRLVGVVDLQGNSPKSGHYTAKVLIGNQWWYLNDTTNADRITPEQVVTNQAYLLFYDSAA